MEPTTYKCGECGKKVLIQDGNPVRSCEHENATVIADIKATAYGQSKLEP